MKRLMRLATKMVTQRHLDPYPFAEILVLMFNKVQRVVLLRCKYRNLLILSTHNSYGNPRFKLLQER